MIFLETFRTVNSCFVHIRRNQKPSFGTLYHFHQSTFTEVTVHICTCSFHPIIGLGLALAGRKVVFVTQFTQHATRFLVDVHSMYRRRHNTANGARPVFHVSANQFVGFLFHITPSSADPPALALPVASRSERSSLTDPDSSNRRVRARLAGLSPVAASSASLAATASAHCQHSRR